MNDELKTPVHTTLSPANRSVVITDSVVIYGLPQSTPSSPQQAANSNKSHNGILRQMAMYRLMKKTEASEPVAAE